MSEDGSFVERLRSLAFVPTGDGKLHAPGDLYDPAVGELVQLLDGRAHFPAGEFASEPAVLVSAAHPCLLVC